MQNLCSTNQIMIYSALERTLTTQLIQDQTEHKQPTTVSSDHRYHLTDHAVTVSVICSIRKSLNGTHHRQRRTVPQVIPCQQPRSILEMLKPRRDLPVDSGYEGVIDICQKDTCSCQIAVPLPWFREVWVPKSAVAIASFPRPRDLDSVWSCSIGVVSSVAMAVRARSRENSMVKS